MISSDTQATLLLAANFGSKSANTSPLAASEYARLIRFLADHTLTTGALLESGASKLLEEGVAQHQISVDRLSALLDRGMQLAMSVENWTSAGLWIASVFDSTYPARLKERLGDKSSPLLFGVGSAKLLSKGGTAVVGSRNADEAALTFARRSGELCAEQGVALISGGARGVDLAAMQGAIENGGKVVGVLASQLVREATNPELRTHLGDGAAVLISPFSPEAPFHAGNAMARNKYIYALADYAIVVSSDAETGGTWSGAIENLKYKWCPLFIRDTEEVPAGNTKLLRKGGRSLTTADVLNSERFFQVLESNPAPADSSEQTSLFSEE